MTKKIIIIIVAIISLLGFGMFIALNSIEYNLIIRSLADELQMSPQAISRIKIKKFPIPSLFVESIKEEGKLELENIHIHFSPASLLRLEPRISVSKNREC